MQKNFTQRLTPLLAAASNWRKRTTLVSLLALLLTTTYYVWAAISVPTVVSLAVSSDKAWNGPAGTKGFTPLNNIVIKENSDNDFKKGTSGDLILTAPAGWVFKGSGVSVKLTNIGNSGTTTQVNIDAGTITYPTPDNTISLANSTTIRIPYSVSNDNRLDQLEFIGLEVMPLDGNILALGSVQFTVSNTANVVGTFPATVANLSQTLGLPRKITFETQPGITNNSLAGDNLLNQPQVRFLDYFGRALNTGTEQVSLSISSGTSGAALTGGSVNAVNGLATFDAVKINLAGTNYKLTATSSLASGTTTIESNQFTVSNKRAIITSLSTNPSCITTGSTADFTATITGNNFVSGTIVRLTNLDNTSLPPADFSGLYITKLTSTEITVTVPGSYVQFAPAGNYSVQVINPAPVQAGTPSTVPFTIHPRLIAGTITGQDAVCAGASSMTYSIPVVAGASAYNWSVPAGATITNTVTNTLTSQITVNFGTATSGNISVTAANSCTTPGPASILFVTVNPFPAAKILEPASNQSCTGVALEAEFISGANYDWLLNGVSLGAANQNTYTATTTGSYSVRVTNNDCPSQSNVIDVVILTNTNIITNGTTASFCENSNILLSALTGENYIYEWSYAGNVIGREATLNAAKPGTYTLKLTTPDNCELVATTEVNELPKIANNSISTVFSVICANTTPTNQVTGSSPNGGNGTDTYEYQWQSSTDGTNFTNINGATGQSHTPASPLTQTTWYQRVVTSGACTDISPAVQVTVNPVIARNTISTSSQTICTGSTISLEALEPTGGAGAGSYTYRWQSSTNGTAYNYVSAASTTELNYNYDPGTFTGPIQFRREVTSGGCTSFSEPIEITVAPLPVANAGTDQTICSKGSIQIGAPAVAGLAYTWSPATGLSSATDAQPTVTLTNNGTTALTQTYTLTVRNPVTKCVSVADEVVITVNPLPQVSFDTQLGSVCINSAPITLTGGLPAGGTYSGTGVNNGQFNPSVAEEGLHIITYTYEDPNTKCLNSASQTITVNPLPVANAGDNKTICSGSTTTTIGTAAIAGLSYSWSPAEGLSNANIAQPTVSLTNTGTTATTKTYRLTVTNTTTNCVSTNTSEVIVTVNPLPVANAGSNQTICSGGSITIGTAAVAGLEYSWSPAEGLSSTTAAQPTVSLTNTGSTATTKTYSLTVKNTNTGCVSTNTSQVAVTVNPLPVANAGGNQTICSGGSTTLGTAAVAGLSYSWSPATGLSNANTAQPTVSLTNTGTTATTQTYTLTVRNNTNDCSSTSQATITVNPLPVANAGGNKTICSGGSTTLGTAAVAGLSYSWSPAEGLSNANIAQPTVSLTNTGTTATTQTYTLTVKNNTTNCSATSQATVTVNPLPVVSITNLTPGQNFYTGGNSTTLVGSPTGGTFKIGNTVLQGNVFNPCAFGAGAKTITYTYSNGTCVNTASVTVNVINSTYTVMNTANPFPICKGSSTTYKATVYRDIVVYDVTDPRHTQHNDYLSAPSWKKTEFIRYWQPEIAPKTGAALTTTDLIVGLNNESNIFNYQWYRNTNAIGANAPTRKNAGLSATDEMYVRVELKDNQTIGCGVTQAAFGTVQSNKLMLSAPQEYSMVLAVSPNPACSNQAITLSATPSLGGIAFTGLEVNYWRKRITNGVLDSVMLNTTPLTTAPFTYEVSAARVQNGDIQNGDIVSVAWQTNEIKCYAKGDAGSMVTMTIALPQTMTVANNGLYCAGGAGVAVGLTNSQTGISYQLQRVNSDNTTTNVGNPVTGNTGQGVTFGNQKAGTYTVQLLTPTASCQTFGSVTVIENPLPITQQVTGNRNFCRTYDPDGVKIGLANSEPNTMYQLMNGTQVVETVNVGSTAGAVNFDTYLTTSTNHSILVTRNLCSITIPVTGISEIEQLAHVVTIDGPDEPEIEKPATYTAKTFINGVPTAYDPSNTYIWSITILGKAKKYYEVSNPADGITIVNNTLRIESVPVENMQIEVLETITNGSCVLPLAATGQLNDVNPLPVELIYLKAQKKDNNVVELEWATAMEQNSEGFEVQVSQDAKNYRTLAFVASKAGGNTTQKQVYTFHDKENGKYGTRYYRLMQRDMNGDSEYFGPKAVKIGEMVESLSAYPNPFNSEVNLEINAEEAGSLHVLVTNAAGAKIMERTFAAEKGSNRETLRFSSNLPQGMYIITTRLNGKTSHFKLMKQ